MKNRRTFKIVVLIYLIIIGTYWGFAISKNIQWDRQVDTWRQQKINNSPTVCVTRTGSKYHRCYHYSDRNYSLSLFEAVEEQYGPCGTCSPPSKPDYIGKPQKPPFYWYNWFLITIGFSIPFWTIYNKLIDEK